MFVMVKLLPKVKIMFDFISRDAYKNVYGTAYCLLCL
jgi:hypothetical protein